MPSSCEKSTVVKSHQKRDREGSCSSDEVMGDEDRILKYKKEKKIIVESTTNENASPCAAEEELTEEEVARRAARRAEKIALKAEKAASKAEKAAALVVKKFSKPAFVPKSTGSIPTSDNGTKFGSMGIVKSVVDAATSLGYAAPSPIQQAAIPQIIAGKDVLAGAQTGTGKTAAYAIPILQHIYKKYMDTENGAAPPTSSAVKVMILTPTRELAMQINDNICALARFLRKEPTSSFTIPAATSSQPVALSLFSTTVIVGGVNSHPQIKELQTKRPTIIIATPGRLLELRKLRKAVCDWSAVEILVLDEADRMLAMGFNPTVTRIIADLPKEKQTLLFSATFSPEIRQLANSLLRANQTAEVQATPPNSAVERIDQSYYVVARNAKDDALRFIIDRNNWFQVLVFTRTKHGANTVAEMLNKYNMTALALHGGKNQNERSNALRDFKAGKLRVLVATDVVARGIDIADLPHVINYELPTIPEDYVHRIGRTGRAGKEGFAVSLVCVDELGFLDQIQEFVATGGNKKKTGDADEDVEIQQPIPLKHGLPKNLLPQNSETPQPILMGHIVMWGAQGAAPSKEEMQAFRDAQMAEHAREFGGYNNHGHGGNRERR